MLDKDLQKVATGTRLVFCNNSGLKEFGKDIHLYAQLNTSATPETKTLLIQVSI